MEKNSLKEIRGLSRYNTITKRLREEIFEWVLYHTNLKASCASSDVSTVFNPESNQKEVFPKMIVGNSVRDLHNDIVRPSYNGGL